MADVSVTAANVAPLSDTQYGEGIAGATITAGQSVYVDASDSNKVKLADANASSAAADTRGLAMHGALAGQPIKYASGGTVQPGFTVTVGSVYVQSATAGGIAPVADLASGHYTKIIGVGQTASILKLILQGAGVAVP